MLEEIPEHYHCADCGKLLSLEETVEVIEMQMMQNPINPSMFGARQKKSKMCNECNGIIEELKKEMVKPQKLVNPFQR